MSLNWREMQSEVGKWSLSNFGMQRSKRTNEVLHELAPLMGLVEELGEFTEAAVLELVTTAQDDARRDAIADMMIYLMDYCARSGVDMEGAMNSFSMKGKPVRFPVLMLTVNIGKLYHAELKGHQGIRGYDDPHKYLSERRAAVGSIVSLLEIICGFYDDNLYEITEETWTKIVKKRDWKGDRENG